MEAPLPFIIPAIPESPYSAILASPLEIIPLLIVTPPISPSVAVTLPFCRTTLPISPAVAVTLPSLSTENFLAAAWNAPLLFTKNGMYPFPAISPTLRLYLAFSVLALTTLALTALVPVILPSLSIATFRLMTVLPSCIKMEAPLPFTIAAIPKESFSAILAAPLEMILPLTLISAS